MPTQLIQLSHHALGIAALRITGPALGQLGEIDRLQMLIGQTGEGERWLDPRNLADPWTTTRFSFPPSAPRREGNAVLLEIDYGVTFHLRANQPYRLVLCPPDGREIEERFTGNGSIRRPSHPPAGWSPPTGPSGPASLPSSLVLPMDAVVPEQGPAAPARTEATVTPAEAEETNVPLAVTKAPEAEPERPKGRRQAIAGSIGVFVVLAAALAWWLLGATPADKSALGKAEAAAETLDGVRRFIGSAPQPSAARAKAETLAQAGVLLDGQFLLYKYAAEKGDRDAARTLGGFYDPDSWDAAKSPLPAPNPIEAARWHKQAAEAGDAESQYRYGMLLKKGRTDEADGPEQAIAWLQKAAEQGHAAAKQALNP